MVGRGEAVVVLEEEGWVVVWNWDVGGGRTNGFRCSGWRLDFVQLVDPSARYHGGPPLGLILRVCPVVLVGPGGLSDGPGGRHRI